MAIIVLVSALMVLDVFASSDLQALSSGDLFDRGRACVTVQEKADSALIYFTEIIERYDKDTSPEGRHYVARAYNNRGYVWEYMKYDYRKATADLLKSLDICDAFPYKLPTEAFVCLNLANIFDNYSNHQEDSERYRLRAIEYWNRSMNVARELKEWEIMLRSYLPLANKSLEHIPSSADRRKLLNLSRVMEDSRIPNGIPMVQYCRMRAKALDAVANNRLDKAAMFLRSELEYIDTDLTPERYRIDTYNSLMNLYYMSGNMDSVEKYMNLMELSLASHESVELRPLITAAKLRYLRSVAPQQELDSLEHTLGSESEEMLRAHNLDKISDLYLENEIEKSRHNELELKKSESRSHRIIIIISIIMGALVVVALVLIGLLRRLRKRNRQLYALAREEAEKDLRRKKIPAIGPSKELVQTKYLGSNLSNGELCDILRAAIDILDHAAEIYSFDFTLARLAQLSGTKPRYLSQAISEIDGRNFNALINERRVREACRRFDDLVQYGNMSVEAVGQSVGFRSRSAFTDAFKKTVGITPSAYARIARSEKSPK